MNRISAVYAIRNIKNGKMYIGQSVNIASRWAHHKSDLKAGRSGNKYLQREYDAYGADKFEYLILEECEESELFEKEKYYVEKYETTSRDSGYNIKNGGKYEGVYGSDNGMFGRKHREGTLKIIREKAIGRKGYWEGKHITEQMRRNLSEKRYESPTSRSRKILCVTTGEVFDMLILAKRKYGLSGNVSANEICNKRKTYGKLPDGTPLVWRYAD